MSKVRNILIELRNDAILLEKIDVTPYERSIRAAIADELEGMRVKEEYCNLERADDPSYIIVEEYNSAITDCQKKVRGG